MANKFIVKYVYEGVVPENAPAVPAQAEYYVGDTVPHATVPTLSGYLFHGWIGEPETMPSRNVTVTGHWTVPSRTEQFTPEFSEFVTLYRGIERVWISDAPLIDPADRDLPGILFAETADGLYQTVGPVTGYFYALKQGFVGTYNEWVAVIREGTANALKAEGYAVGKHNGTDVPSTDEAYHNNAKYWAEERAKKWAIKSTNSGEPGDTNNAEYYSDQSASSASDSSDSADASEASSIESKKWANGRDENDDPVESPDPAYHDNAKYWADKAHEDREAMKGATTAIWYMNSSDGVNHPAADNPNWSSLPNPTYGLYMWTKIVLTWNNEQHDTSTYYEVTYIGRDGPSLVTSVNSKIGDVVLDSDDLLLHGTQTTVTSKINSKADTTNPIISGSLTIGSTSITEAQLIKILALINAIEVTE